MAKQRRSFSVEQKRQIIQEADQQGITQTLRKHNISHPSTSAGRASLTKGVQLSYLIGD